MRSATYLNNGKIIDKNYSMLSTEKEQLCQLSKEYMLVYCKGNKKNTILFIYCFSLLITEDNGM